MFLFFYCFTCRWLEAKRRQLTYSGKKILSIQSLNEEDKTMLFKTIDALLRDANTRKAYAK